MKLRIIYFITKGKWSCFFFFVHCGLCALLFRILTRDLYMINIQLEKSTSHPCLSVLFPASPSKRPHLPVITVITVVFLLILPHPFFSAAPQLLPPLQAKQVDLAASGVSTLCLTSPWNSGLCSFEGLSCRQQGDLFFFFFGVFHKNSLM